MKLLLCVIIGCAAVLKVQSRAIKDEFNKYYPEEICVEQLELDRNEMMRVVQDPQSPEGSEDAGNFFVCIWNKRGVMKNDGTLSEEELKRFLEEVGVDGKALDSKTVDVMVEQCKGVQGLTPGETGIQLKNCIVRLVALRRFYYSNIGHVQ